MFVLHLIQNILICKTKHLCQKMFVFYLEDLRLDCLSEH